MLSAISTPSKPGSRRQPRFVTGLRLGLILAALVSTQTVGCQTKTADGGPIAAPTRRGVLSPTEVKATADRFIQAVHAGDEGGVRASISRQSFRKVDGMGLRKMIEASKQELGEIKEVAEVRHRPDLPNISFALVRQDNEYVTIVKIVQEDSELRVEAMRRELAEEWSRLPRLWAKN